MLGTSQQNPSSLIFLRRIRPFLILLILAGLTLFVFRSVKHFDFVNYDDDRYLVKNPYLYDGLSWKGVQWAFTADLVKPSPYVDYWQPVTLLSRMLDVQLFGLNAHGHHAVNLMLHTFNVILVFELLWSLTGALGRSFFVAALFALHPLQVEPVVWVTARKDLLCFLFGLLAVKAYTERSRFTLFFFLLSLMSKPMLVTLPLLLILLDFWPLRQNQSPAKSVLSKWPFLVLSAVFALIPLIGQPQALKKAPFELLIANIPIRYENFIEKFFYPAHLAVYSPGTIVISLWPWIAASALLAVFTFFTVVKAKNAPYLAVGWFWYLISLLPIVGSDRFEDRFMYIPIVGLGIVLVWGLWDFLSRFRFQKIAVLFIALTGFGSFIPMTLAQIGTWKNSFTLFERSLEINPVNFIARNQLCAAWLDRREPQKAAPHCAEALKINSYAHEIHYNLALAEEQQGNIEDAIKQYEETLWLDPEHFQAHSNLGNLLAKQRRYEKAVGHFSEALRIEPESAEIHFNLANVLLDQKKNKEAIIHYEEALRLKPRSPSLHQFVGILLAREGKRKEAAGHFLLARQFQDVSSSR